MYALIAAAIGWAIFTVVVAIYQKNTNAFCKSKRRLDGKTALVTGGTTGMGLEIAKDFATRGAKVIICCPFNEEGVKGREEIIKESGNNNIVFKHCDLSSLSSVRKFADDILKSENRLDILVNNAGVSCPPDFLTPDGMNFIMQVNYFGHFLLTILLLPLLKKSTPSRIINTSSVVHRMVHINIDRLCSYNHNWFTRSWIYAKSKHCLIPFTNELSRKLEGTGVVVNAVDPGAVGTRIFDNCDFYGTLMRLHSYYCFKTAKEGAQTAIHVAVDESTEKVSGKYFQNCAEAWAVPWAKSKKLAIRLWEESIRLVKLTDDEVKASLS